jgi:hypothetical protein
LGFERLFEGLDDDGHQAILTIDPRI